MTRVKRACPDNQTRRKEPVCPVESTRRICKEVSWSLGTQPTHSAIGARETGVHGLLKQLPNTWDESTTRRSAFDSQGRV